MNPKFLKSQCVVHNNHKKCQTKEKGTKIRSVKTTVKRLDQDIIGARSGFWSPFGWKNYSYMDHTASGKALKSVETFIEKEVLPHYANTHTTVSNTSAQTTIFRNEARDIVKKSVGASEDDDVIFCGSGSTSAVHKLLHHISYPKQKKIIVFVGPYEHHSNILPWRSMATKVIQVPMIPSTGYMDVDYLEKNLKKVRRSLWGEKDQLILGCFSAGSNATGALTDDVRITELLHKYGGLAFWDYAAAGPHVPIIMNPGGDLANKDALFFSGHKFLGGPQTPGVLVVKRHVLQNPVPHGVGGGTVVYVTRRDQKFLSEIHEREEGGTPDIVGSIRLGLAFRVRNAIGIETIMEREANFCSKVLNAWDEIPEIHILGSKGNPRLPIISFMIQHVESGYFLHYNFVVALLNDLFGIQCRGGCMCAGPYGEVLLGVDGKAIEKIFTSERGEITKYSTILKPGFVRISLNFHCSTEEVDFVIEAVKLVALYGWKLLPMYSICLETGTFNINQLFLEPKANEKRHTSLNAFNPMEFVEVKKESLAEIPTESPEEFLKECLRNVEIFMKNLPSSYEFFAAQCPNAMPTTKQKQMKRRWFMIQNESAMLQQRTLLSYALKVALPFKPVKIDSPLPEAYFTWKKGSIPHIMSNVWMSTSPSNSQRSANYENEYYWDRIYSNLRFAKGNFPGHINMDPIKVFGINYDEMYTVERTY